MKMPKPHAFMMIAIFALASTPLRAGEKWSCVYTNYRQTGKEESSFQVDGNRLVETSGDAIVDYQLLENSTDAIVATKGSSYAGDPWVMGFLVMIRKQTGEFVLATASVGSTNGRQTGQCHLSNRGKSN
jgi:hypothetical protein